MAINKNFVVKNGLEVYTDLILANATTKKVGIGSTNPRYSLDVRGGIGATDVIVSGVATISNELRVGTSGTIFTVIAGPTGFGQSVGVGTANPGFLLDVRSPVSTGQTALYVQGDVRITGDLAVDDISFDQATLTDINVTGIATVATLGVSGVTTTQHLRVTGVSTLGTVQVSSGIVTATSGIVTYYGDTSNAADGRWILGANGSSDYTFTGIGFTAVLNDPTLYLTRGRVYEFVNTMGAHPFRIQSTANGSVGTQFNRGVTNNDVSNGTLRFEVPMDAPSTLYYQCTAHAAMGGVISIIDGVNLSPSQINVSGISTLGTVQVSSGIITATSGIVTYYGDGSYLTGNARNLTATIGIGTSGVAVGYGVSFLDLRGPGLSTVFYNNDVGIATIFFQGGGSGSASIGIGTTPGDAFVGVITAGNLWYNSNLGRLFIYYQDNDSAQWVDAAPFNVGIITSLDNATVSFAPGSASSPSMHFVGDIQTGFFSPGAGEFTVVSLGSSILNINPSGINVTGIITSTRLSTGNVVSSGIVTAQDFDALSDQNYKENVTTVNNALLKVEQLRGVKFDWKESGLPSYGVIAQELQEVLPELVHGNDPKTVNYNGIIGVLIEAIKELKAEVEELKNAK